MAISRRGFLGLAALAHGCSLPGAQCLPLDACAPSAANPEGPYYRADAPSRSDLNITRRSGTALHLSGRVTTENCSRPIPRAMLDVWQADGDGIYDLDTQDFALRGRVTADDEGNYALNTVRPGGYFFGGQPRARHIHVKVSADGFLTLTTQLYFPDDPMRAIDAQYACGLDLDVTGDQGALFAAFNFVLRKA